MLKVGGLCKVIDCAGLPEFKGITAELVNIQTQEFELYTQYPLWARVLSGMNKGKVYGFRYYEVEELTPMSTMVSSPSR